MSEVKERKFPLISFTRKIVQLITFIAINFVALELIFNVDLSVFKQSLNVFPFIQTPRDAYSVGAGIIEYIFYSIANGTIPYLLIGAFFLIILFTARFSCGWLCPAGFIQDLIAAIPRKTKNMSINTDKSLKKIKFAIIIVLLIILIPLGILKNVDLVTYTSFNYSLGNFLTQPLAGFSFSEFLFHTIPYDIQSLVQHMSLKTLFNSGWSIAGLIFYIIIFAVSIYYPRFYCRTLCPYGAAAAYLSEYSFLKLKRNPVKCVGRKECGLCEKVCPVQVRILDEPFDEFTGNGECNLCGRCKEACPYNAINLKFG